VSYLRYICLLYIVVSTHIVLCFCFVCLRLVCPMLPVSLDCPFLIVTLVFSKLTPLYTTNIYNVNKTRALLKITGGKDEPNIFMRKL
jgi:hypothetical protein